MTPEKVRLSFTYTEKEYLEATRLLLWKSSSVLTRLVAFYSLICLGCFLLLVAIDVSLPLWSVISLLLLVGVALYHGVLIDLPRRHFRGDPKFRDEYNLSFSDEGIGFKTRSIDAFLKWSLYTRIIESENFYLLIYGRDIYSASILPKRAFRDSMQEAAFRQLLRRNIDRELSTKYFKSEDAGKTEYVPSSLDPPDWR
jgi:YcxB-like protein